MEQKERYLQILKHLLGKYGCVEFDHRTYDEKDDIPYVIAYGDDTNPDIKIFISEIGLGKGIDCVGYDSERTYYDISLKDSDFDEETAYRLIDAVYYETIEPDDPRSLEEFIAGWES